MRFNIRLFLISMKKKAMHTTFSSDIAFMSFGICKFCEPRPAKNPRLLNYFQLAHTGYKTMDFISRVIQRFMFRGSFVAFSWSKMALSGSNILIKLELGFFLIYILKLRWGGPRQAVSEAELVNSPSTY